MKGTIRMMIVLAILVFGYRTACADSLQGLVVNESNKGIPGLTVSLALPDFRSAPSITDSSGHYSFPNVPHRSDPYYLEVRWGTTLLYRKGTVIDGDRMEPPIKLNR